MLKDEKKCCEKLSPGYDFAFAPMNSAIVVSVQGLQKTGSINILSWLKYDFMRLAHFPETL